MKQSMKKAALVLMLALAVLLVPQWSNTALADRPRQHGQHLPAAAACL